MAQKCGSCQIQEITTNGQNALAQCEAALAKARADCGEDGGVEQDAASLQEGYDAVERAQKALDRQTEDNFNAWEGVFRKIPDFFEGKPTRKPVHHPRQRLQSILRREVFAEEVVTNEPPRWRWSAEFDAVEDQTEGFIDHAEPIYEDYVQDDQWSYDSEPNAYDDVHGNDDLQSTDPYWNAGGWTPYAEAPDLDDVYRTRSFLSPVQEETELDRTLSTVEEEEIIGLSTRETTACHSLASTPPSSPGGCPSPPSVFDSPVEDLASTLHVPSSDMPPLQLLPAFSFENLHGLVNLPAGRKPRGTSAPLSKRDSTFFRASDESASASGSDKPSRSSSSFWSRRLEH